jgi:hypothetical protein
MQEALCTISRLAPSVGAAHMFLAFFDSMRCYGVVEWVALQEFGRRDK